MILEYVYVDKKKLTKSLKRLFNTLHQLSIVSLKIFFYKYRINKL